MKVCKQFSFDAAHYLPGYNGKCSNMHGHHWVLQVELEGPVGSNGMVVDFSELKELVNSVIVKVLDHRVLNDLMLMPTCENILLWIDKYIRQPEEAEMMLSKASLVRLRLYETPDSFAELKHAPYGAVIACH